MDSGISNPSLVIGLMRPTMDPTQIKFKDPRRCFMLYHPSSVRAAKSTGWLRVVSTSTGGSIPRHRKDVAISCTNHWCNTPSGKPWRRPGSPSRPHATPSRISFPCMSSNEGNPKFAVRWTDCEFSQGGGVMRIDHGRSNSYSWIGLNHS